MHTVRSDPKGASPRYAVVLVIIATPPSCTCSFCSLGRFTAHPHTRIMREAAPAFCQRNIRSARHLRVLEAGKKSISSDKQPGRQVQLCMLVIQGWYGRLPALQTLIFLTQHSKLQPKHIAGCSNRNNRCVSVARLAVRLLSSCLEQQSRVRLMSV